jgi:hypothetical protein
MMEQNRPAADETLKVLDLFASVRFKTQSSVCFSLGRRGTWRAPTDGAPPSAKPIVLQDVWKEVGWADVHHPCEGHIKAQVRIVLPPEYRAKVEGDVGRYVVLRILSWVGIRADETYEARFHFGEEGVRLVQHVDRRGMTDRIVS